MTDGKGKVEKKRPIIELFKRYLRNRYVLLFFVLYFEVFILYGYIAGLLALGMVFACLGDLWMSKHEKKKDGGA